MLKVNIQDGKTVQFDLETDGGRRDWESFILNRSKRKRVTGLTIHHNKTIHTFPIPRKIRGRVGVFGASIMFDGRTNAITGEIIWVKFHGVKTSFIIYKGNSSVTKVELKVEKNGTSNALS